MVSRPRPRVHETNAMYVVSVETTFSALHRVRLSNGDLEPLHGHDWVVRAYFRRDELDQNGMVIDFEKAQAALREVLSGLHHTDLGKLAELAGLNPTAEVLAAHVYRTLRDAGLEETCRIEITETPGCVAVYEPTD